jgi:hypothetical protein
MWEALRRFKALEPSARGLFLRAAVVLPFISISLRLRGLRATQSSLQKLMPTDGSNCSPGLDSTTKQRAGLVARMVRSAAYRGLRTANCLDRSLALWWLLGRQGIASSVRIGTRKTGGRFEAHAWVECDGVALNEPEEPHEHYAAFDEEFPALDAAKK